MGEGEKAPCAHTQIRQYTEHITHISVWWSSRSSLWLLTRIHVGDQPQLLVTRINGFCLSTHLFTGPGTNYTGHCGKDRV